MFPARHVSGSGGRPMADPCGTFFRRIEIGTKEIQKPRVFGGVLSPISFAAERNGAAGGKRFGKAFCTQQYGIFFSRRGKGIFHAVQARPSHPGKKGGPPAGWSSFLRFLPPRGVPHSVMIFRITRSVSRIPSAASTPTWRTVSSTSSPTMPSPERKLSPLRYMS